MEALGGLGFFLVFLFAIAIIMGLRLVNQYEKGVVFRLGRVQSAPKEPGLRVIIPFVDVMRKVDMRIVTLPVDSQQIITKDNVSIDVAAVAYYQVTDATKSLVEINNVVSATYQIAQTTVRNVVGQTCA
jgi:regulator of protease activity HflC (stomatin/prohibitin superfamily)